MDILDESLLKFWKLLNHFNVSYIMVGGFAVNMHGFTRATDDIDIWLQDDTPNRINFGKAMAEFGYKEVSWEHMQFVPGWTDLFIGPGIRLDIMTAMKGLEDRDFDEALQMANRAIIEGIEVPFLHINQLIANKKAVNRPKDQIDLIELEKIKVLLNEKRKGDIY